MTQAKRISDAINQQLSDYYTTLNAKGLRSLRIHVRLEEEETEVTLSPDFSSKKRKTTLDNRS